MFFKFKIKFSFLFFSVQKLFNLKCYAITYSLARFYFNWIFNGSDFSNKRIQEKCNCKNALSEPYYLNINRDCVALTDIQCAQNVYVEYLNEKKIVEDCDCPRECHKTDYSVTLSYANYPTLNRARNLAKYSLIVRNKFPSQHNMTHKDLEQSILAVNIYYNDLKEITFTQKPKMVAYDLFSKIGAQMSIFLGLSILSFAEIIEFILGSLIIACKGKVSKN